MSIDEVQQNALQTYNENIEYFKQNHPDLYKNLELYAAAIELEQVVPQFELQYLGNYFDIVNPKTKQFLYAKNSNEISQSIVDGINFDATVNSFKTYYEFTYNDIIAKSALEQDILAPCTIGNAPIINFVNKNLPNPQNLKEIHKFIIFGVLLGIHIPLIHQKLNSKVYLIVEPNLEFFRLSLFVTNYANLAKQTKLFFSIAQNDFEFKKTFEAFYGELFIFNHYLKFVNISAGSDIYMKTIQNFLVSQGHLLYSYDRTFLSISRTNSYINQNFKLLNIKTRHNLKPFTKPVLYLAAGPSLQHNIEFVKKNQDYFTIVAIYATMPILERNGIKPDIITQYDEQDVQVLNTLDKLKDLNYFKDTIFIFASHVNAKLMNSFPKENIFIFQAMFELKENFGTLTSPSIGELTYALLLLLQAKEIYLLGLDFAMDVESGNTHIEGHSGSGAFNKLKDLDESSDKNYSFRKNTIIVKGNFIPEVKSIPVFKTSIDTFGQFTEMFKDASYKVYNLSNGAYLRDTIPLKIENINLSHFIKKEQPIFKEELFNSFVSISEAGYNEKDLEKLNLKLSGVKKIKKYIEQFQKIKKYKDFEEYKGYLIGLIQNILFEKLPCEDLQSILINYSSHNLHHLFYLFDLQNENDNKKYIYEINKNLLTQINKIVDTYVISISYSNDENSITLKKLNKYLKEYSIKNSIYCEPFFKELVETSKNGYQYEYKSNSIGFFAIEDNLSNKEFINYIKEILKRFTNVELKLFYFFEFQKIQAQYIFKQELNRTQFLIPHNISTITSSVELWIETYENTINVKKLDDIILNNYENIYSIMFKQAIYNETLLKQEEKNIPEKFILANNIKDNFLLPNTKYFEFANSFKDNIDKNLLNEKYLKEHIGFFAFKENLQKEFINHIVTICNKFPNLKFSVFYFEEEDVKEFINIFKAVINRFRFLIPKSIYDISNNCEIWVQAEIKNQSFLLHKIYSLINNTNNIYPIVLNEKYTIKDISNDYLENLIENYNETTFTKTLNSSIDEVKLQNTIPEDNIGFFVTKDNLEDSEFIKLITILLEKNYDVRYKAFYFNKEQKELASTIFVDHLQQIDFITPSSIYDIVKNISTYIYSFINFKKPKTSNYHKISEVLKIAKANIFQIHLYSEIKDKNIFYNSIDLIDDSKLYFQNSIISSLLKNSEHYNKFNFINSLNQKIPENIKNCYQSDSIGFLGLEENIKNTEFNIYIKKLMHNYKNITFTIFYFTQEQKNIIELEFNLYLSQIKLIVPQSLNDIVNNLEIYITSQSLCTKDTYFYKVFFNILYNFPNITTSIHYTKNDYLPLKQYVNKDWIGFSNIYPSLKVIDFERLNYNPMKVFIQMVYNILEIDKEITDEIDLYEFSSFTLIDLVLNNKKLKLELFNYFNYYK